MKTLKTLIACLILAISCVALIGCDKDNKIGYNEDKEDNSSKHSEIIGSWRYVENAGDDSPIEIVWVFSADGRFYQTFPADSAFGGFETREGTYQYDGKTLTIRYNGEMWSEIYNVVISGDSMTVMPNNNEVPPLTFHRQ